MPRWRLVLLGAVGLCLAAGISAAYFKLAHSTTGMPAAMLQASATMFTISFAVMALAYTRVDERITFWLGKKAKPGFSEEASATGQKLLDDLLISLSALAAAAVLLLAAFVLAAVAAGITEEADQARRVLLSSSLGTTILAAVGFLIFMFLTVPFKEIGTTREYLGSDLAETPANEASAPAPSEAQPARADLSELARPVEPPTAT